MIDTGIQENTRSLTFSGSPWSSRMHPTQRDLVRILSRFSLGASSRTLVAAAGDYLLGIVPILRAEESLLFSDLKLFVMGPHRWNYSGVRLTLPDGSETAISMSTYNDNGYLWNDGQEVIHLVNEGGDPMEIAPGQFVDPDGEHSPLMIQTDDGQEGPLFLDGNSFLEFSAENPDVTLNAETLWVMPLPKDMRPIALMTSSGLRHAGVDFFVYDGAMALRFDPVLAWPDRFLHIKAWDWTPPCARHYALRTDAMKTSGIHVALYKRDSQSTKALLLAAAEIAGIPILEEDGYVSHSVHNAERTRIFFTDGRAMDLPGSGYPVATGDLIPAGTVPYDIMRIRSKVLHGDLWYSGRIWYDDGIPASVFFPGDWADLLIRKGPVTATCYADPVGGGLRARFELGQNATIEAELWEWQASAERLAGTERLADILGFTTAGEQKTVDALGVLFGITSDWGLLFESSIWRYSPAAWKAVLDFLENEKPSGILLAPVRI